MDLRHIVAATDESDAGRRALLAALALGRRVMGRVTVMRVISPGSSLGSPELALEELRRWLEAEGVRTCSDGDVRVAVSYGVPSVEICRFAERQGAGLLVLGRKPRSSMARMLVGDTADAVARRSQVPCLFVPPRGVSWQRVVAAVDGTERGMAVLLAASDLSRTVGAELRAVTVERHRDEEPAELASSIPSLRAGRLRPRVAQAGADLEVRLGDPVEQIVATAERAEADVLMVGYHRGGPPGILEAGSTARRLVHTAPCAVVTIPL